MFGSGAPRDSGGAAAGASSPAKAVAEMAGEGAREVRCGSGGTKEGSGGAGGARKGELDGGAPMARGGFGAGVSGVLASWVSTLL